MSAQFKYNVFTHKLDLVGLGNTINGIVTIDHVGADGSGNFVIESTDGSITITDVPNGINLSASGGVVTETITGNDMVAVPPTAGNINLLGTGSLTTSGNAGTSTETISLAGLTAHNVLVGAGTPTIGLISPSTAGFVLTSNGAAADPTFQAISATGAISSITGNSGGAEVPLAGNFNILGTGSITVAGSANTETVQLTGLTNHALQIGAGTATLTQLGAGTTGQVLQTNTGADPTWSTATYPSTTTINQLLYSSSANTVAGLATANNGTLITSNTGVPSWLANSGTPGEVLTSNAGSPPSWQPTAASSISITGDSGGALTGSAFTFTGGSTGMTFAGATTTETLGGTLNIAHGGTGTNTLTGILTGNGTSPFTASSVTQHDVLVGGASNAITSITPSTAGFVLTSNGTSSDPSFQSISASGALTSITGNSGGAEVPLSGNFNILGTGSITVAGSANTETVQLTGLTNHALQVGAGTATLTQLGAGTTGQVLQTNTGADPTWSTATYPSTTTANDILYSSSNNVVGQITAANDGVLISSNSGVPSWLANSGTAGWVLTANTGAPPSWQAASGGSGIMTIDGDTGSITGSTVTIYAHNSIQGCGSTVLFSNTGTTSTLNVSDVSANTLLGSSTGNATLSGGDNTGFGSSVLSALTSGSLNTCIGANVGTNITSGASNVGLGNGALGALVSGNDNTAIGINALATTSGGFNTTCGAATLSSLTSGTNNIALGYHAGSLYTSSESSNIIIGSFGTAGESNVIRIGAQGTGTAQQSTCYIAGIEGVTTTVANRVMMTINSSSGQVGTSAFSVNVQTFTANGTYTPTTGMVECLVEISAGGGGGGGAASTSGTSNSLGGGGGAGEYAKGVFSAATIGSSQTVTIGAGGTANSGTAGGSGGTTSLGALITALGGAGGTTSTSAPAPTIIAGALGGTGGTGGSFRSAGAPGSLGLSAITLSYYSGQGGSSIYGAGGLAVITSAAGNAGLGHGAGGSGACNEGSQSARSGGAGSGGIMIITEYIIA